MIKRTQRNCSVKNIDDKLERFYDLYPEYRGDTPNKIIGLASHGWLDYKIRQRNRDSESNSILKYIQPITTSQEILSLEGAHPTPIYILI